MATFRSIARRVAPAMPSLSRRSADERPSGAGGWRWAIAGLLLGIVAALVLFAPARWLAAGLSEATQGRLVLVNPRGTVWSGNASVVFSSGASGAIAVSLPGTLHWRLRPGWRGVTAVLDLPCCTAQPLELKAGFAANGGVRLDWQDGESRWPAAMLAGFGAPWNTLRLDGVLDLSTQALSMQFSDGILSLSGRATLDATDLSSSLSTLRPMGSYRIALAGGPAPSILLSTQKGSLELNGSGSWNGRALRFNGEAIAAPGREDALSNLMNIIGRRDSGRSIITLG